MLRYVEWIRLQTINTSSDILIYITCIWLNVEICCMDGFIRLQTLNTSPDILIYITCILGWIDFKTRT